MPYLRSGMTLPEIMIVIIILSSVVVMAADSMKTSTDLDYRIAAENDLTDNSNRVLNDLALELRNADYRTSSPANLVVYTSPTQTGSPVTASGFPSTADIFQYKTTVGMTQGTSSSWVAQTETGYRYIVWDTAKQTLTKYIYSSAGALQSTTTLCDEVSNFFITQMGNTLAVDLTLKRLIPASYSSSTTYVVQRSDAKVLFLRSTLDTMNGAAPYSSSDNNVVGDSTTDTSATIYVGHMFTGVASNINEVTVYVQPMVGQSISSSSNITIQAITTNSDGTSNTAITLPENTKTTLVPFSTYATRVTQTTSNGNWMITVTGTFQSPIQFDIAATTDANVTRTVSKQF